MKKLYAFLFAAGISVFAANAQVISIGTDVTVPTSGSQYRSPWTAVYDFSYVQTIYLQTEINTSGNITSISYKFDGPSLANSNQLEVYMGTISKAEFDGTYTDWVPTSAMTLVFNGTITPPVLPDWVTITLTTPYNFQNDGNLVIAIHEKSAGSDYVSGLDGNAFEVTDMGTNRVMYAVNDDPDPNPDPNNPPEADNMRTKIGNIRINFGAAQPVGLDNFSAIRQNNTNSLKWNTRSEQHNKGFNIQRSADGISFDNIGFVPSLGRNGTSVENLSYSFADNTPFKGNNYYRLQQLDMDGKTTFSRMVIVKSDLKHALNITTLYPNPVKDELNVVIASATRDNALIEISDMSGKKVFGMTKAIQSGDSKLEINTSSFAPGVYTIKATLSGSKEKAISQFVKK